jgi:hypothetical protein
VVEKESNAKEHISPSRRSKLKKKYGLTPEAYDVLLNAQDFKCRICRELQVGTGKDSYRGMAVDHDHKTCRVRGLLCTRCNLMLGYAVDNPTILLRAIQYLKGNL